MRGTHRRGVFLAWGPWGGLSLLLHRHWQHAGQCHISPAGRCHVSTMCLGAGAPTVLPHLYWEDLIGFKPCLSPLVVAALCRGRVVRVPAGSLVRVVGTELVIPCNVSDYDGPSEQNFDWSFLASGSSFVELASTWEVGFPAQLYRERLQRGDIVLRRTANDAVELHIKNVQPSDQGHYKCSTPSTDATVQGNYEDTVQVKGTSSRGAGLLHWRTGLSSATQLCGTVPETEVLWVSVPTSVRWRNNVLPD